jgi:hypothetical protein
METAPFVAAGTRKQADLDLIADAPRLAEENERLRGLLAGLLAEYSTHNEHNAYQMYSGDLAAIKAALAGREEGAK